MAGKCLDPAFSSVNDTEERAFWTTHYYKQVTSIFWKSPCTLGLGHKQILSVAGKLKSLEHFPSRCLLLILITAPVLDLFAVRKSKKSQLF